MNNVRREIRELISINEKIQSALVHGDHISNDEAMLIRQCAAELLEKIPAPAPSKGHGPVRSSTDVGAGWAT